MKPLMLDRLIWLKDHLDTLVEKVNRLDFIDLDPISIPSVHIKTRHRNCGIF